MILNTFLSSLRNNKLSWLLLILFFIFDNVFSYYAVTQLGGREANIFIATWVERYPLLYFACIPAQVALLYGIEVFLTKLAQSIFRNRENMEHHVLRALALFWAIGISSMNMAFLIGYRQSTQTWMVLLFLGLVAGWVYIQIAMLHHTRKAVSLWQSTLMDS